MCTPDLSENYSQKLRQVRHQVEFHHQFEVTLSKQSAERHNFLLVSVGIDSFCLNRRKTPLKKKRSTCRFILDEQPVKTLTLAGYLTIDSGTKQLSPTQWWLTQHLTSFSPFHVLLIFQACLDQIQSRRQIFILLHLQKTRGRYAYKSFIVSF